MGKSIRNTETVSSKDDVLSLLGGEQTDSGGPRKQAPKKEAPTPQVKPVNSKDEVMDLLSGTVKKKDGGGASSGTQSPSPSVSPEQAAQAFQSKTLTSQDVDVLAKTDQGRKIGLQTLSPEAKDIFATAHNGPKKSDLVNSVTGLIDTYFPESQDQAQNKKRFDIKQSVLSGSQKAILGTKNGIIDGLQKQIDQRQNEIKPFGPTERYSMYQEQINQDPKIQQLRAQQKKVSDAFDEYGKHSLVSSKDMQAWLKLDEEHPNIQTSIAAEKLGKEMEDKYGAERHTPNKEHDRIESGFRLIMEGLQMDINEALAYGIPSKNPELMKKAQDKLNTLARYRDMYNKLDTEQFPDVGLDKTARFLGDIIAEKHPNKLIRTAGDVREAANIANERNPGFLDKYGKFVDIAAEKQDQGTFIPRGGGVINELVGGAVASSAKNALDLLKWKARAGTLSNQDTIDLSRETSPGMKGVKQSGTEPTKIVYDKEGKAYREIPNENYSTLPWNNLFRFAGESLPGLAEFVASESVGKVAGEALSLGRMGVETKRAAGLVGATYLTSYNTNREFADANIEDKTSAGEAKKIVAANFLTLANAGIFHILNASPSKMVEAAISKNAMPDVIKMFEENSWEKLSQKDAEGFLREKVLPRAKAIVEKFGESAGNGFKMGSAAVVDQKLKDLVGVMTNTNYKPSTIEDNARTFVQQALLMTGLGLPGMISSGIMPHSSQEALHQAGLYAPQYIDMINERVESGELDPRKAAGMISMVKTMGEELQKAAVETTDDGTPLTTRQQRDLAIANFKKRGAAAMEENKMGVKGSADGQADKEIKEIKKENNWQSIEETPVFKSIKSEEGEKVATMSDIDPTKKYTYEKEEGQEPVTTDGAALINHLETGDIYEKERPDNKVEEGNKAPDAEGKNKKPAEDKNEAPVGGYEPHIREYFSEQPGFFTAEERTKLSTLDDAGKDQMIDDKKAQLSKEPKTEYSEPVSEQGRTAIKEANERKGEISEAGFDFESSEEKEMHTPTTVPIGFVHIKTKRKGLGTLGYILEGEKYLKEGKHMVSSPNSRKPKATGVWKKLVGLGLATEPEPGHYKYGGEREKVSGSEKYKPNIRDDYFAKADFFSAEEKGRFESSDGPAKDKMIDDKRAELSQKGENNVSRETISKISNTLEGEIKEIMQKVQPGTGPTARARILSELPRRLYEKMAEDPSVKGNPEAESKLQEAFRNVDEKGAFTEETLRKLSGAELAEAPRRLLEALRSEMALPSMPPEATQGPDNVARAEALQGSYDRLLRSGSDPDEPEMRTLKSRIDALSAEQSESTSTPNIETHGNVKNEQGGDGEKSSPQSEKSGQEGQKNDEKGNVTSDSGKSAEPPTGSAPVSEENNPVVGIRDSIVNAERIHKGIQPLVKEFVRSWGSNWNELKRNIRNGFSPRKFIEETATKIGKGERVVFNDYDYATLLFDRLDIQNNIARATDALTDAVGKEGDSSQPNLSSLGERTAAQDLLNHYNAQLEQNDIIGRAIKSETGRALSAIQMMTSMNGELLKWSADIAHYYNGHVPDSIKDFVARIEKEYKEKNEQLRTHYEEQLKKAANEEFKKVKKESTTAKPGKKSAKAAGKDLADKIRALRPKNDGNLQASIFGLPIAVYDTALVAIANAVEAGASLVDAIQTALKDVTFDKDEDRNSFISHLQNTEDPERPEAKQASLLQDIKSIAAENDATNLIPEAVKSLRDLMRSYVQDGSVKTLDELVNKTHDAIKETLPDAEERDIRDAFSGYGAKSDTEGKLKSEVAKLKEQARTVSQYQDMLERPAGETKAQEQKRLTRAAELYKKVQSYMREMGIDEQPPPTTTEGKIALALEQAKKRAQSVIQDLTKQILAGERKQRNNVEPDHDLSILRAERKRLSDQLNQIDKANVSPEEKIKQTEDALNRQVANYERQIRDGVDPLKPKEDRPTTKQIEELRERKKELKKQVQELRDDADPRMDPKQKALAKYNESLARQIKRLDEKIENKDYEPDTKPPIDFDRDPVSLALEARLKKLQSDFYATKRAGEAVNKRWIQKVMTFAAAMKRAFVLSRISTFGRLGAAVGWNTVFEPAEATTGAVMYAGTKIGFGKNINRIAERYGVPTMGALGTLIKGEATAFKALGNPQTWRDFVSDAKNGYSELSLLYGHGNESIPKEARDTWMNIQHGLESFGRAHGAVKGVSKRMEFMRSYTIRKEALRRKGEDIENPVIQQSIGAMAYQDALRSILMEDNYVSEKYQKAIHELQKGGFGANMLALSLQEMMPIVKIPTNLVLNAGRATLGTPLAGGAIAVRGLIDVISGGKSEYGISKLSASEADAILRNLRKGNVGMALMLGGFFAPNMFGASHYYKKGTDQPDGLEEGEVKFFGLTVPKWLADNPYLVTMKIGSSLRNSFEYYTDQKDQEAPQAAVSSFVSTAIDAMKETPILGTPSELIKAAEGYGGDWFWYSQVKGTLEPGILQEIAEDTDNKDGWYKVIGGDRVKRKSGSVGDALKTGIPGLRQQVDEK